MSVIKACKKVVSALRTVHKPLSVHCEALHISRVEYGLKGFLKEQESVVPLFCVTPSNKSYVQGTFGPVGKSYVQKLEACYLRLRELGNPIQLHVHLTLVPNVLSWQKKFDLVYQGLKWMRSIGLSPTELALGWWMGDRDLVDIALRLELRLVEWNDYRVVHDYEL